MSDFNITEYIRKQNEAEHAPPATPAVPITPAAEAKPVTPPTEEQQPDPRTLRRQEQRRQLRDLETKNAELSGRLSAFEEQWKAQQTKGTEAKPAEAQIDPNAKPTRAQFANDADFAEAIGRWAARQETEKAREVREFEEDIRRASAKASEDITLISEWEAHQAEAEANGPKFNPADHTVFMNLLATSRHQAFVLDYLATNHEEMEDFLALKEKPQELIEAFRGLEGHVGRVERKTRAAAVAAKAPKADEQKPVAPKPAKAKAPVIDEDEDDDLEEEKPAPPARKKLPTPSEAVSPKGGTAANMDIPPLLPGGKINPAWAALRNQQESNR